MIIVATSIQHLTLSQAKQFEAVHEFLKILLLETEYVIAFALSGPFVNGSIHIQRFKKFPQQLLYSRERTQISAVVITTKSPTNGLVAECGKVRLHDV